jgi:4-aminobutyrate aminotransferase-like enzyme
VTAAGDKTLKKAIDEAVAPRIADYYTYLAGTIEDPFIVERTDLLYVFDQYRQQYLDFTSGEGLMPLGHNLAPVHAAVAEHLNHYVDTGSGLDHVMRWPVEYAKMLSSSLPEIGGLPQQVVFTVGPHDAYQLAQHLAERNCAEDGTQVYGGDVASIADHAPHSSLWINFVGPEGTPDDPLRVQNNVTWCKTNGTPVVANETLVGFGRLGTFWGQTRYQIDADITVIGGPVGGGFSLGVVIAPVSYWANVDLDNLDLEGDMIGGPPVVCAAGAALMSKVTSDILEHVTDVGPVLNSSLREVATQFPDVIREIRGAGLCQAVVLHPDDDPDGRVRFGRNAARFRKMCRAQGLLVAKSECVNAIVLTPPLIISENEIRRGVDMLAAACLEWEAR